MEADISLAARLESFASWAERHEPSVNSSELEDIRLAAKRLRELTPPDSSMPQASQSSQ